MSELFADRLPPHSLEAERAVLGAILMDPQALTLVAERLRPDDFYRQGHQRLFQAMLNVAERGEPIDLVTVTEELQKTKQLEEVGGVTYLTELADSVPTSAHVDHYARIVEEKAILRRLIRTATQIASAGYAGGDDVAEIIDEAERKILDISQRRIRKAFLPIRDLLMDTYERIEQMHENRGGLTGIPTGFPDLDRMTSGLQRSDLIILAARPSMGKTAFALNLAQNVALHAGETVAIFNMEMPAIQLVQRMLSAEGNIDAQVFRTGNLGEEDWEKLTMAIGTLAEVPIFIDDTPGLTVFDIRAKLRRLQAEHGLGLVVIDYLQLIRGRGGESRQQEISEISRSLKLLARELNVPVIALSQLSRAVEQRQDKRPMLSDLRESGSIEQDADIVAFLYRDDYYNEESERKNIMEVIIGKHRNGPVGKVELLFLKNYNKFLSLDLKHDEPPPQ
ncbi:primary replicative DNA helicase [Planifilum fulgidum]|jgi:replicative DNA helicase|uniref:Replicative DNA helicase n=1 Tax=Planifilum fulgidum TaxID=201973 RepID=A0A1I2LH59_9BACL|nr:replicative DNA helicase [Planifilum fulgidum]MBO2496399.1 replicative DNA helicase [Bacillota bacterium]MBO2531311.1 replicative DNA helicase [Thermoactinomycetaceae bacterium]SFF78363.1 primary replicative DNA helicase [Planifilum fulgidum]